MRRQRSESEQQIADLLQTARKSLRLSVAFLSRMDGTTQHLEVVDSSIPLVFHDGITQKQETTSSSPSSTSSPAPGSARRPSARFPADCGKAPDVCFAEAHSIGAGDRLELLAHHRPGAVQARPIAGRLRSRL